MPSFVLSEFVEPELSAISDYIAIDNGGEVKEPIDALVWFEKREQRQSFEIRSAGAVSRQY